jgi:hypothetical protein
MYRAIILSCLMLATTSCRAHQLNISGTSVGKGPGAGSIATSQRVVSPSLTPWLPALNLADLRDNNTSGCAAANGASVGTTSCASNFPVAGLKQTVFPVSTSNRSGTAVTIKIVDNYNFSTTDKVIVSGLGGTFTGGTYQITSLGACTSSGAADCTITYTQGSGTASSTGGTATRYAQTDPIIPAPSNVANKPFDGVDVHDLPYLATGQKSNAWIAAHFMPWFSCSPSSNGDCVYTPADGTSSANLDSGINQANSHLTLGYVSNSNTQLNAQIAAMIRLGFDGLLGDSSGAPFSAASATRKNEIAVFDKISALLAPRTDFQFAVLIDDSSFKTSATCGSSSQQPACVEKVIECSLDYWNTATSSSFSCVAGSGNGTAAASMTGGGYFGNASYFKVNGHPVTGTFMSEGSYFTSCSGCAVYNNGVSGVTCTGSSDCWTKIWAGVTAHQSAWSNKPIYYWRNNFTHGCVGTCSNNGSYRWINPTGDRTNADFTGYGSWVAQAAASTRHVMATGYAHNDHAQSTFQNDNLGFDSNCGQNWLTSFSTITNSGAFSPAHEPDAIQVLTWNDMEQGTAIEPGISGCYTISASITTGTINYSLATSDATFAPIPLNTATNNTLDHLSLIAVKTGGAIGSIDASKIADLPVPTSGSGSIVVSTYALEAGAYTLYLRLVPRAGMVTSLSAGMSFTAP